MGAARISGIYIKAEVRDANTVAFTFAEDVRSGDLFHWGFDVGANPPGDTSVQPSLTGLTDDSGITPVAAVAMPVP
jgi:hypothetical protein